MAYPPNYLLQVRNLEAVLRGHREESIEKPNSIEMEQSNQPDCLSNLVEPKTKKKRVRFATHDSSGKITTVSTTHAIDRKGELDSELLKLREICLMLDCLEHQIRSSKSEKKEEILYFLDIRFTRLSVVSEKHILELELIEKEARLSRIIRRLKEKKWDLRHEVNSWLKLQERTWKPLQADLRHWGSRTDVASEANLRAERFQLEFEVGGCRRTLEKLQESLDIILLVEKAAATSGNMGNGGLFHLRRIYFDWW